MKYKFNITPDKCRFIINEKNRTVTCILEHTKYMFMDFARENFNIQPFHASDFAPVLNLSKRCIMPNRFYGTATCSEDDEWNVEYGKVIAFSRMKDKLNRSFFKRCHTFINTLDQWLDDAVYIINQVGDKLSFNAEKRHDYIESLIGPEEKNVLPEN